MRTELNATAYNDVYKYGYDWSDYQELGEYFIKIMQTSGAMKKKILDIGCGLGWLTDMMYFNVSKDVTGIDFSTIAINFHARKMYPACKFMVANAYEFDYSGYEVFTAMETFEHLDDLRILGKLPKGALFFGTVPLSDKRDCEAHLREYTTDSIQERYKGLFDFKYICKVKETFIFFWGNIK